MKKIIFILIILAVLLFSGCDAMLEVFYPEFAEDFNGTNNLFAVEYYYDAADMLDNSYNTLKPLKVELYSAGDPTGGITAGAIEVWGEYSYYFEFFVPAGSYDVWIWQDSDDSGSLDTGDFVLSTVPSYTFTGSEEYRYEFGTTWTQYP